MNIYMPRAAEVLEIVLKATDNNAIVKTWVAEDFARKVCHRTVTATEMAAALVDSLEFHSIVEGGKMIVRGYFPSIINAFTKNPLARLEANRYIKAAYIAKS